MFLLGNQLLVTVLFQISYILKKLDENTKTANA